MANYKNDKKKILNKNTFLFLQIFQSGAFQLEKKIKVNSLFFKKISIGSNENCDLFIPFARNLIEINIFKVGRNSVEIILDPRLDGFIKTDNKFGTVKEFISPRGSLIQLSSIEDPLLVSLAYGSRGKIKFFDFDIIFKIEKEIINNKEIKVQKISNNIFQLPEYDLPIERNVIPISLIATIFTFFPILIWLMKSPLQADTGLINLPQEIAIKFIAPENIRLLPFVYKSKYNGNDNEKLAIFWIFQLQKRWESAEVGINYQSIIPFLQNAHNYIETGTPIDNWEKNIYKNYKYLDNTRISKYSDRYFSFLKPYPAFSSVISGIEGSSQYVTLLKRLRQLKNTDNAILEYLSEEHLILKDLYETEYHSKKIGIVDPPSTGQVIGPQPDKSFNIEYKNYKSAEQEAKIAENSSFRKNLIKNMNQETSLSNSVIWISNDDLIIPSDFRRSKMLDDDLTQINNMMHNAYYSVGIYKIPPLPRPKATIDSKLVDFVIFNKQEEIRSCYNSALRKFPNLQGSLVISWKILENGKAKDISIVNTSMVNKNLLTCIESRVAVWNFPKPKNGYVVVTYPFQFTTTKKK